MKAKDLVHRLLGRVCSPDTMTRIVEPTLADMGVERERSLWHGYLALARALMLHAVLSAPQRTTDVWRDEEHAIPRLVLLSCAAAVATALPFALVPALGSLRTQFMEAHGTLSGEIMPRSAHTLSMFPLLLRQALVITLPPAILLAWPPWALGLTSMAVYLVFVFALDASAARVAWTTAWPSVIFAWLPTAALLGVAFAIWRATATSRHPVRA